MKGDCITDLIEVEMVHEKTSFLPLLLKDQPYLYQQIKYLDLQSNITYGVSRGFPLISRESSHM